MKKISIVTIFLRGMRDKRILYIASEDTPGMRPYASSVMKAVWDENSWAIIVLRSEKSKLDYASFPQDKITYIYFPKNKFAKLLYHIYPIKIVNAIKRIVKEDKIDLIHTLTGEITLSYVFASLQRKICILHTVHDAVSHDSKFTSIFKKLKEYFLVTVPNNHIINTADNVISNSKTQIGYLQEKFPEKKCFYSPFPTLVNDAIKRGESEIPELNGVRDYVLFFGNVNLYKGVHLLYSLYVKYKKTFKDRKLVIAGLGDYYFDVEGDVTDVIRINRYIDDSEIRSLFKGASIVVYPYISATQTGVLSIASYFGKKMVLSDIPFFRSVAYGYRGVEIVDVENEDAFLNAIDSLMATSYDSYAMYKDVYDEDAVRKCVEEAQKAVLLNLC